MTTALQTLTNKLAERFEMGSSENLPQTLMATAFRGQQVTPDQMTALLVVANQHGLNPWTNEIYAFPNNGGIIPIVGVDGWSRIMNDHSQYDGIEFKFDEQENSCTCTIYRKDRKHPIVVTEYLSECQRSTQPWKSHPKRMLRHKAMIQCARLAFGFTGIYDQDEAERIAENREPIDVTPKPNVIDSTAVELVSNEQLAEIKQLIETTQSDVAKVLAYFGQPNLESLTATQAVEATKMLKKKLKAEPAQTTQPTAPTNSEVGEEIPL